MEPLSKKTRKRTLWFLLFLFITVTPLLIGYSRGYRMDDALGLIQTGGIYIHSNIPDTYVFLDDEFVENNGVLWKSTFIQDLLPNKHYLVRVESDKYQSWVKDLEVEPNLVTEARVLMLPKELKWEFVLATTSVTSDNSFSDATTTKKVLNPEYKKLKEYFKNDKNQFDVEVATSTYEYIRGKRYPTTTSVIIIKFPDWLSDFASSSSLYEKDMVKERGGLVTWLSNGNLSAAWGRKKDSEPYFFCTNGECKDIIQINWQDDILRYEFYPNRNDVVIVLTKHGLYAVELDDRSQRNIQPILEEDGLDFRILQNGTLIIFDGNKFRKTSW